MKKQIFFIFLLILGGVGLISANEPFGVFVNMNTNSIQFIDPVTQTVSGSLLKGSIGSYTGLLMDVVITPDGKTAMISNFRDQKVFFIDISGGFSDAPAPTLSGKVNIGFYAEDMVISPDGKYLLVSDGGFSSRIAVIDVTTHKLVKIKYLGAREAQAIEITPDGKNVLAADNWAGKLYRYHFSAEGNLTFAQTVNLRPSWPTNVTVSPDGRTVFVVCAYRSSTPVLAVSSTGELDFKGFVQLSNKGGQSCVFSSDGTKAYYLTNSRVSGAMINVFTVMGPGEVSLSKTITVRPRRGIGQFYGIDTMAIDPWGNYLYITNPAAFGAVTRISIIDLTTEEQVNFIDANGIPTGIAFTPIQG